MWRTCCLLALILASVAGHASDDDDEQVAVGKDQPEFSFGMVVNETDEAEEDEKFESEEIQLKHMAIFIRSQHNSYHKANAEKLKENLLQQASKINGSGKLQVVCSHDKDYPARAWTINPIVKSLRKKFSRKKWIFFCEETTEINLEKLLKVLGNYDSSQEQFLAHGLHDASPSVIHHYSQDTSFEFPDFDAGWALSLPLLGLYTEKIGMLGKGTQFTIDVKHEIAKLLHDGGKGIDVTNVPEFCVGKELATSDCATVCNRRVPDCPIVPVDKVFVAVKTYHKFHETRLPITLNTIGKQTKHILYYSDREDKSIPTVTAGVVNTERGHCKKTENIIRKFNNDRHHADKAWLVIVDDDTIMNLDRLRRVLGCYNPDEPILLGERYGFGLAREKTFGYDYITGGGGMILSRGGVKMFIKSGCKCSKDDLPDDMWLGSCFSNAGVPTVHHPSFHQARPWEYAPDFLAHQYLVSFHKHINLDPMEVYNEYLADK